MMIKRAIPFVTASSIYDIPPSFYRKHGIEVILSDLDNTLDSYKVLTPSSRTKEWLESMEAAGIRVYLASNNTNKRVLTYAKSLGVSALSGLGKPFAFKMKGLLKKEGFPLDKTVLVGDQVLTDVLSGNGAGLRVILVEPLTGQDPWMTRWNRRIDRSLRKKIKKGRLAPEWKELA